MNKNLRADIKQLTAENRRSLRHMARYLDSYALNDVAYEELISDLVGMALECQERRVPFLREVGMDEAAFCRELVQNCPRETRLERVLALCRWFVSWVAMVLPLFMLLKCLFRWMPGRFDGLTYVTPFPFFAKYCILAALVSCGFLFLKRNTYRSWPYIGALYLSVFLAVFVVVSEAAAHISQAVQLRLSLILWLMVFGGLWMLLYVARRCVALTVAYRRQKQRTNTP